MENLTRRQLLQAGAAAGTLAAGISAVTGPVGVGASPARVGGIHIHGNLDLSQPSAPLKRLIDLTVFGPDDNLGGIGIDVVPDANNPNLPGDPDVTQCLWTARGSLQGDVLHLVGRVILSTESHDNGSHVTTDANMTTGRIKWTFAHGPGAFVFEGTCLVVRI